MPSIKGIMTSETMLLSKESSAYGSARGIRMFHSYQAHKRISVHVKHFRMLDSIIIIIQQTSGTIHYHKRTARPFLALPIVISPHVKSTTTTNGVPQPK